MNGPGVMCGQKWINGKGEEITITGVRYEGQGPDGNFRFYDENLKALSHQEGEDLNERKREGADY